MARTDFDLAVRRLAFGQHGVFSSRQVRRAGGTAKRRERRVLRGDWEPVAHGVYRLAGAIPTWRQAVMTAVLVAGEGSAASHLAAAALWRFPGFFEDKVEVIAAHGLKHHRLPEGVFHESRRLPGRHLSSIDGIPVTTVERTLCDLAGAVSFKRLERAVDNAIALRRTTPEKLVRVWADLAARGRPGVRAMRAVLLVRLPGYVAPASELEARFLDLVASFGMEAPVRQLDVGGEQWIGRVDFAYRKQKLLIELDGRFGHASELDRARDRQRDDELTAAGWRVLRFTWEDVVSRPSWVLRTLRTALAAAA